MNRRTGFTLIEMLAVIVIISILIGLMIVVLPKVWGPTKAQATQAFMLQLSQACAAYKLEWGDYPPSDLQEIGGAGLNDLNNGIEALTACLASKKRGRPKHYEETRIGNVDSDDAGSNITGWEYGGAGLRELMDEWDHPLVYFHCRDYEGKNPRILKYKLSKDAPPVEVKPARNTRTGTYYGPGSFQILSVGADGKPGTEDDIVVSP